MFNDEWITKCGIYTREYYAHARKDEITKFAATHLELEYAILNDISQMNRTGDLCII